METKKSMHYQDEDMFIGWLEEFSDYKTQGSTLDVLQENLKDIYDDRIFLSVLLFRALKIPPYLAKKLLTVAFELMGTDTMNA